MDERLQPVQSESEIVDRLRSYVADPDTGGPEIHEVCTHLATLGPTAFFGGMIRDLARGGPSAFRSDVDLVVDAEPHDLDRLMECWSGQGRSVRRNRFGGYRVTGDRHVYDIWAASRTWAVVNRHVEIADIGDLVRSTFFDWDAVLVDACTYQLHTSPHYDRTIRSGVLDVVLAANPDPVSSLARTIRAVTEWDVSIGPRLAAFLRPLVDDRQKLQRAFVKAGIPRERRHEVENRLRRLVEHAAEADVSRGSEDGRSKRPTKEDGRSPSKAVRRSPRRKPSTNAAPPIPSVDGVEARAPLEATRSR